MMINQIIYFEVIVTFIVKLSCPLLETILFIH